MLVVLDSTSTDKLVQFEKAFTAQGGEVYIGEAAWQHVEEASGETMAKFLDKYVRAPLGDLLREVPHQLPKLSAEMLGQDIKLFVDNETLTIHRSPMAEAASDEDEMPEDVTDQLPES